MKVLIGCEHSGNVRRAFRALGHDAWSCDLLPASDSQQYHFQCDVLDILNDGWNIGIFHPPCTYLTCSAEWAYGDGPYHQKVKPGTLVGAARRAARAEAVAFVRSLLGAPIEKIALENPIGHLSSAVGKPQQTIQPHWFGEDASKATCLWLKNLPPLVPTKHIAPRMVNGRPRWANQTDSGQNRLSPSDDRWAKRSHTYPGSLMRLHSSGVARPSAQASLSYLRQPNDCTFRQRPGFGNVMVTCNWRQSSDEASTKF